MHKACHAINSDLDLGLDLEPEPLSQWMLEYAREKLFVLPKLDNEKFEENKNNFYK
jgi:hypothetical protein